MKKTLFVSIAMATIGLISSCGYGQENRTESFAEMNSALVEPATPGFNPDFIGLTVSVKIQTGSNPCFAQGVTAELLENKDSMGNIILTPSLVLTEFHEVICTMQFMPVYETASVSLQVDQTKNVSIFIRNMGGFNSTAKVFSTQK